MHALISAFYSDTISRNMSLVSEKLLFCIYTLKRNPNKENLESLLESPNMYSNSK
jgi:hypothetical protein